MGELILCERANHSSKEANISLLILSKGGLRELALVLTPFKGASPRSERTNPSSKPMQGRSSHMRELILFQHKELITREENNISFI